MTPKTGKPTLGGAVFAGMLPWAGAAARLGLWLGVGDAQDLAGERSPGSACFILHTAFFGFFFYTSVA